MIMIWNLSAFDPLVCLSEEEIVIEMFSFNSQIQKYSHSESHVA